MKKALSLITAFAMVCALALALAPAAEAADLNTHTHDSSWIALNADNIDTYMYVADAAKPDDLYLKEGKYYLTSDIALGWTPIDPGKEVTICLNGHKIDSDGTEIYNQPLINVEGAGTVLNICDCKGGGIITRAEKNDEGKVTKRYGSLINVRAKCTLNIYGGKIVGPAKNEDSNPSSISSVGGDATMNIYGGSFQPTPGGLDINNNNKSGAGKVNVEGLDSALLVRCTSGEDRFIVASSLTKAEATVTGVSNVYKITPPAAKPPVNTGDNTNVTLMVAGLLIGLCGIASVAILPKKQSI